VLMCILLLYYKNEARAQFANVDGLAAIFQKMGTVGFDANF